MPFWQFFRNRLIGWIGHALLVQPCKTENSSKDFFPLLYLFFLNEIIVRSNVWSFGHSDPDPSSVLSLSRWSFPLLIDFGRQYSKFLDRTRQTEITVYFFNQGQMIKSYFSKLLETKTENFLFLVYWSIPWAWKITFLQSIFYVWNTTMIV